MNKAARTDKSEDVFLQYLRKPRAQSLARVVDLFYQQVWNVALRVTGNEEDAADVTQDFFLGLLLSPPTARSVRSARGYLAYRVLTLAARRTRATTRREKRETAAALRITSREVNEKEFEALRLAIDGLPNRIRAVVELHYLGGYTCREIAEMTSVSERTVAIDLQKGREKLRQRLGQAVLGTLAFLHTGEAVLPQPPPYLLENLTRIARSGSALSPLVTSSFLGALMMKKLLISAVCIALALLSGSWVIQKVRSTPAPRETQRVSLKRGDKPGPPPAPLVRATRPPIKAGEPGGILVAVDEDLWPIPEASASYAEGDGEQMPLKGEPGRFELPPVTAAETAKAIVSAEGYFPETVQVSNLSPGESREVVLMAIHELSVRTVIKATGGSVASCEVHVYRNLPNDSFIVGREAFEVLVTGGDGKATVPDLRSTDKVHLFAVQESSRVFSAVEEVKFPFDTVTLLLKPMEFVRGTVRDEDGSPIAGADLWLHEAPKDWNADWRLLRGFELNRRSPLQLDRSDDEGRFLLRWPVDRRPLIAARADGYVVALRDLQPEELGSEIELVLEQGALIEGVVLDENGQPATSNVSFAVAGDDPENADPVKPWRVYYHVELNVPYRFVLKDIEYDYARYLIVDHRGKYKRKVLPLTDAERRGEQQLTVILEPDLSKPVLIELAMNPFDRVTGSPPLDPYPQVSVYHLPSEEGVQVEGNKSYGGFAWWCAVEPGEYRIEVMTPGFLPVRETVSVREGSKRPSESRCCSEQFRVEVPIERDPALRGQFDLPELLHLEILNGRDRKPPPERSEIIWQAFHLPDRKPAFDQVRAQLEYREGAARLSYLLKAGEYEVRLDCEGFLETTFEVNLPQASAIQEVLLFPEWKNTEEAKGAIPGLVRKLRYDIDERYRAQRALVRIGQEAATALMDLLSDDDHEVRSWAIFALGQIRPNPPRAFEMILHFLRDPEATIRSDAARALGNFGQQAQSAVPALVSLLKDPEGRVRSGAATALGMLGPAALEATAPLELLLSDKDEFARLNAKRALERIAAPEEK